MTPSAGHNAPKADLPAHSQRPEDDFNEFVSLVSSFCTEKSFQDLRAKIHDYDTLQKKLGDTKIAYDKNLEELTRKVAEDKAAAHRQLKAEQDITTTLKQKIKSLEEDVRRSIAISKKHEATITKLENTIEVQTKDLEAAKKKAAILTDNLQSTSKELKTQSKVLERAESELTTFRSYTATLTPLNNVRVDISDILGSSFKEALALFKTFLGRDVDGDRLQDSKCWDRVRDHVAIQRTIPLPASNSVNAKQMRAIAGLVVYSRALAGYVFRPTYLSLGTGAEEVLDALPAVNAFQDTLVRAVLLEMLPDQQKAHRDTCAKRVVEEVLATVAGWLPTDQQATFKLQLSRLTSLLCGSWQRVQRLHERVEPIFAFEAPDDWKPLPSWVDPVPSDNKSRAAPQHHGDKERPPRQLDLEPAALSAGDVVKVVWPAFLATSLEQPVDEEEGTSDLVHHGFVLTRADIQGAANEETPRRAMRKATRDSNAAAQRSRRDSAVFLSHGASDGLDVK